MTLSSCKCSSLFHFGQKKAHEHTVRPHISRTFLEWPSTVGRKKKRFQFMWCLIFVIPSLKLLLPLKHRAVPACTRRVSYTSFEVNGSLKMLAYSCSERIFAKCSVSSATSLVNVVVNEGNCSTCLCDDISHVPIFWRHCQLASDIIHTADRAET